MLQGLNWYANISLVTGLTYTGSMTSTVTKAFDPVTGLVTVNDLQMDTVGMAHVKFTVYSVPTHYSHEVIHELSLYPTEAQSVTIDTTSAIKVKFNLDYATYGTTQFGAVIVNYFQSKFKYMKMSSLQVSQGRTWSGHLLGVYNVAFILILRFCSKWGWKLMSCFVMLFFFYWT